MLSILHISFLCIKLSNGIGTLHTTHDEVKMCYHHHHHHHLLVCILHTVTLT